MTTEEWFRSRAKELYHDEGEIEIDGNARVSVSGEDGAYVEAWVWVPSQKEPKKRAQAADLRPAREA
jgi:hypothetical protein